MCVIICRLQHENLVDMVGFSCDGQYPCVIYPLMSNGSLLDRLACLVSPTWLQLWLCSQIYFHRLPAVTLGRHSSVVMETEVFDS